MATFLPGPAVSDITGSVGGVVFSKGRHGAVMRNRSKPVNPRSSSQSQTKLTMQKLSVHWSQSLSAAQRSAWDLYGQNVSMTNSLGQPVHLTGFQHFQRSNSVRVARGHSIKQPGPVVFSLPESDPTLYVNSELLGVARMLRAYFDTSNPWVSESSAVLYCFSGRPVSPGQDYYNGPWLYVGRVLGNAGSPPSSPQYITGAPRWQVGQKVFTYALISRADGRLSGRLRWSNVIVP